MIPKFMVSASLAGLLASTVAAGPLPNPQQAPPQQSEPRQQSQQAKSTSGKVTNIAKDKRSFSVQQAADSQDAKGTIVFMINGDTQIKGQVTVGTDVDVEYRTTPDGNLALVITPRSAGGGQ